MGVREHGEYAAWVRFFCECLLASAEDASGSLILVKAFVNLGILVQPEKERQRYRMFLYEDYLAILRQGGDPLYRMTNFPEEFSVTKGELPA